VGSTVLVVAPALGGRLSLPCETDDCWGIEMHKYIIRGREGGGAREGECKELLLHH